MPTDEEPTPSIAEAALDAENESLPPPSLARDGPAVLGMGLLFLASIGLAMAFSYLATPAFANPESTGNAFLYLGIVVVFTLVILAIVRWGKKIVIKWIILASVLLTAYYVIEPLAGLVLPRSGGPLGFGASAIPSILVAGAVAVLLWFYPEWYIVDAAGILVAAGAAGIFGISFGIKPALVLLVAFAVYDAIAVYRTKHMLDLADSVLELRLPIMFVVPKSRGYSFLAETRKVKDPKDKAPREAMFMGLGDAVIPGILVVSALTFLGSMTVALATLAGSLGGFGVLMYFVLKGRPHAGLPLLNGGAIVGFLAACIPLFGLAPLNPFGG